MRECGDCTLCCTLLPVKYFDKPANTPCKHCDVGCTIHAIRPDVCRSYNCEWLLGELQEDMRPDKTHVVMERLPDVPVVIAVIEPGHDEALPKMTGALQKYVNDGITVVATNGFALMADGETRETIRDYVVRAADRLGVVYGRAQL